MRKPFIEPLAILCLCAGFAAAQEPSDFFAQKSSYFRDAVIEGASKHAEAPVEAPATVTVVTREEIELYGFRTVADVLNFASIGYFTHNDRRYDFVGGRGMFFFEDYNTRLLVMLNGHPLNESWGNFGGVGREMVVPLELAERVEIIYGPSSLLYGGYSLYGIVNVVTATGGSMAGARLRAGAGTWETSEVSGSWGASGTTGSQGDRPGRSWDALIAGGWYTSGGEDLSLPFYEVEYPVDFEGGTTWGGRQSGTDFERAPFLFGVARWGELSAMIRQGGRKHGTALAPYESVYGSRDSFTEDEKDVAELRWDHELSRGLSLSARLFRDAYHYHENDTYFDDETYEGIDRYRFVLSAENEEVGGELRMSMRRGAHLLTGGIEYRSRDTEQRSWNELFDGSPAPDGVARETFDGSLTVFYLQEEWRPSDHWTFVLGGNYADTEPGGAKAQPRLAVIFKPVRTFAVKALYGRGFRPPSAYEAGYSDYIDFVANPTLESEEIGSAELSMTWEPAPSLSLQAFAFDSRLEGLIRATEILDVADIQGGVVPPSGDPEELLGIYQYQSAGDVESRGFGAGLRTARGPLRGYLNLSQSTAHFRPNGSSEELDLPSSSDWLGSAGLAWDAGLWAASLSARWVGAQDLDPDRGLEGEAGDFVEANTRLLWRTSIVYPVTLTLDVRNLFDSRGTLASIPIYTPERVPIEGRRAALGLDVRF